MPHNKTTRIPYERILVTGGAGFIGSHFVDALLANGCNVIALDNLYTGSMRNLFNARKNKNFKFIRHDIQKPLPKIQVDAIANFACPASPVHYQKDPVATIRTNVLGMAEVLELARKNKVIVLQASTSEVYGDPLEHPQKETYFGNVNTLGPRACYDEGKRCAETLCMDYHRQFGVPTKIVRIFNTYGPRMAKNDGRVVSNFIVQALAGKPITIYGDGSQTRSFCYVSDLVSGIIKMLLTPRSIIGPVNLGNPSEYTIEEMAHIIVRFTGSDVGIVRRSLPADDPKRRKPDISLARKLLKWEPVVSLEDGLKKTIEYFRSNMK